MNKKPLIIAVVGPTASGKSDTAIELALGHNGEIVSCDSMQIYKGMDIGTAKVTPDQRKLVPHHTIDIIEPSAEYSCAEFTSAAGAVIDGIVSRGRLPILCGGTGLYVDNIIYGTSFSPDVADGIREELERFDNVTLYEMLRSCDPETAVSVHMNNRKRVIRALEIYKGTGKTKSEWDSRSRTAGGKYDPLVIGLAYEDRKLLYERIEKRVDKMISEGLEDEVRSLYGSMSQTAAQAIGYRQMIDHIEGRLTLEEAADEIKKATRRYAKRQMTWFRRDPGIEWINITEKTKVKDIVNNAEKVLTNRLNNDII